MFKLEEICEEFSRIQIVRKMKSGPKHTYKAEAIRPHFLSSIETKLSERRKIMKKSSYFTAVTITAGWLALSASQVEAGWGWLKAWRGASGVYRNRSCTPIRPRVPGPLSITLVPSYGLGILSDGYPGCFPTFLAAT
ncbi:MAG: hypothetical protein IH857_04560 [Deltaproteobacteria bacterium]|nr:hypothetical protein [Deltaproteobacteria bacterium]